MTVYTAEYWSHELQDIVLLKQEFEGSPERIATDYFGIYGDILGTLTDENGTVVYDHSKEVQEFILNNVGW